LPSELTFGDWIAKPIKAGKKIIKPNWEGLSEEEVELIRKFCKKKVLIKNGIPFTPAFLLAFLATIIFLYGFSLF